MDAGRPLLQRFLEITAKNRGISSVEHVWDLRRTVLTFLALTTASILLMAILFPENAARYAGQLLTIAAACGVALVLIRRNNLSGAAKWLVTVLWVFLAAGAWTSGGLESSAVAGFLVVVALSGLLLGIRSGLWTALFSIIGFVLLVFAHGAGLLPAHGVVQTAASRALDLTLFTAILIGIQAMTLTALDRATTQTERKLEARVDERTAELREAVAELEESNRRLDAATRTKNDFLASMSHELRTPLNSIIGFAGVLDSGMAGPLSDEQERQVRMIGASGQRLLGLVNQVLDLSKIETDEFTRHFSQFDIADVVRRALDVMRPAAREKGLDLASDMLDEPVMVISDRSLVDQVLLNLLGNAVKFTSTGAITVRIQAREDGILLEVTDTGIGIEMDQLPLVFERFYQVTPDDGGKHEGTGLGLFVSRQIIEALGGHVHASSEPGRGSVFGFTLPQEPSL